MKPHPSDIPALILAGLIWVWLTWASWRDYLLLGLGALSILITIGCCVALALEPP